MTMTDPAEIARGLTDRVWVTTEEVDGHKWGRFTATELLGGKDWEICFNCGMIRRRDKQNSPCRGPVKVSLR